MNRTSSDPVSAAEPERAGWPRLGASSRPELRTLGPARVRRTHRGDRRWADRSSGSPESGPRNSVAGNGTSFQPLARGRQHPGLNYGGLMAEQLTTERLVLRPWRTDDAESALGIYGAAEVGRWLSPAMDRVRDVSAMRLLLQQWDAEDSRLIPPAGRWAIELRKDERLVGGAILLPLPPRGDDLEMGWQLLPVAWGQGYATEAGRALAAWAFSLGIDELLAVVRPANRRARRPCAGSAWSGWGRRTSTTTYGFRCTGCGRPISSRTPSGSRPNTRDPPTSTSTTASAPRSAEALDPLQRGDLDVEDHRGVEAHGGECAGSVSGT